MRRLIALLVAPALVFAFVGTAKSSELTGKDSNPSSKPAAPVEKHFRNPRNQLQVSMDVLVDGNPARVISHNGKLYLPVPRMGAEFEIRVNNFGPHRVAAIISVDGLSVIKGNVASERSLGYLVDARGNVVIKGWRRDMDKVAAFTFEERANSYAYLRGYGDNIGVIGLIAIEEESFSPSIRPEFFRGATAAPKSSADLHGGTGAGWGREIGSSIVMVPFVRSNNKQTVTIYYDTPEALRRIGVPVDGGLPKPFPADAEFCPPPSPKTYR